MRRTAGLLGIAAAAMVSLVASAVPGSATPAANAPHRPAAVTLGAVLVGGNEVPGPGDTDGFGLADVRVESDRVCWRITVSAVDPITAGHIHAGPVGVSGPVVVPFDPYNRGCADVRHRLARFIKQHPEQFYVNVHNAAFPGGVVRGQLLR